MPNQNPFPLMPPKSTELRLMSFDDYVYTATPSTNLYRLLDALTGSAGAGALVNEIFLARLQNALDGIYFTDLDFVFGKINFLARSPAESYSYSPMTDMLTSTQWSEVRQKDAWYRARIKEFFKACGLGGTPDGIRMCVQAALAVDCDIYETWRYFDNFGLTEQLGRGGLARNEVVVQPHKGTLGPDELRLVRDMLAKIVPVDALITVDVNGLAVRSPVKVNSATADSTYYEVQKMVTASPAVANLPAPDLLPIDLLPTQTWLLDAQTDPQLAPYAAFNISSEFGYYYLVGGGSRSPIDSVTYGTINPNPPVIVTVYEMIGSQSSGGNSWTTPQKSWLANQLDPRYFRYVSCPYSVATYPPSTAITSGVTTLTNLINATSGPFILVGYSFGAIIVSNVYDAIRSGPLVSRATDFLGGFVFGNARRQSGHTFPNCPDPGGQGVLANNLLANSDTSWWEFAVPGDIACTNTDPHMATAFENLYAAYAGSIDTLITSANLATTLPAAAQLLQALIDIFYGYYNSSAPHFEYETYAPVPGDVRSCVQIARDQIGVMKVTASSSSGTPAATNYPMYCYEVGEVATPQTASYISENLASSIKYLYVPYPATNTLPLNSAITTGVANLTTLINQNPGKFMLVGTGEGAMVTSLVADQITNTGTLSHRQSDFVAAVAFGNPRRQAGKIAPGTTDPGGQGIASSRMTATPSFWYEYVNANDPLCTNPTSGTTATLNTNIFQAILSSYTGTTNQVTSQFPDSAGATTETTLLLNVLFNNVTTGHTSYGQQAAGATQTSYQLAVAYLNTFAPAPAPAVTTVVDPMSTYQPAANYQTFDLTGQYTAPKPWALADSPDNFPGGEYGIHPSYAPALNPDGTPYIFKYTSQTAYVAQQTIVVLAQGGLANADTYQLPLSPTSSTAQVFYPEYAIAYYPPVKDSTVTTAVTARTGNPANQTTLEARDPTNFQRI